MSKNILIVDDDTVMQALLTRMMRKSPYTIHQAENGRIAIEMLREKLPDIVLLDQNMPGMDGLATFREIHELYLELPVIMMTAQSSVSLVTEFMRLGGNDFIEKLFDCELLTFKIENVLATEELRRKNRDNEIKKIAFKKTSEALSELFSTVAHELRIPLTVINQYSGFLADGIACEKPSQDQAMHLHTLRQNTERMCLLINDIIDFSRIEQEKAKMQIAGVELNALIESTIQKIAGLLTQKPEVTLEKGFETMLPLVAADVERVEQVVINLIVNAFKFTERGSIRISTEKIDDAQVRMLVADTGCGMSASQRRMLFRRFTLCQKSDLVEGSGLGLAITKMFVEKMGGTIDCCSLEGRGTTFCVVFPIFKNGGKNNVGSNFNS